MAVGRRGSRGGRGRGEIGGEEERKEKEMEKEESGREEMMMRAGGMRWEAVVGK